MFLLFFKLQIVTLKQSSLLKRFQKSSRLIFPISITSSMSSHKDHQLIEQPLIMSTISYKMSNDSFIENGWTKLPNYQESQTGCKIFDTEQWGCFKKRSERKVFNYRIGQEYKTGALYNEDGTGEIYYINGKPAIKLIEHPVIGQRVYLYDNDSVSENCDRNITNFDGRVMGWFDSNGNCAISDEKGGVLISYDQTGGVMHQNCSNRYFCWQWCNDAIRRFRKMTENQNISNQESLLKLDQCPEESTNKSETGYRTVSGRYSKNSTNVSTQETALHGPIYESNPIENTILINEESVKNSVFDKYHMKSPIDILKQGDAFHCKINQSISLWITNQEKIDLCFSSHGFFQRIPVGIKIKCDFLNRNCFLACKHNRPPNFKDKRVTDSILQPRTNSEA